LNDFSHSTDETLIERLQLWEKACDVYFEGNSIVQWILKKLPLFC